MEAASLPFLFGLSGLLFGFLFVAVVVKNI